MNDERHATVEEISGDARHTEAVEIDLSLVSSVTLARLAEEVKNDRVTGIKYDRVHNRHNR